MNYLIHIDEEKTHPITHMHITHVRKMQTHKHNIIYCIIKVLSECVCVSRASVSFKAARRCDFKIDLSDSCKRSR